MAEIGYTSVQAHLAVFVKIYLIQMYNLVDRFLQAAKNKDIDALGSIFTDDAVYIEINGATYNGLSQIRQWFKQKCDNGSVNAWEIRKIVQSGENGAAPGPGNARDL